MSDEELDELERLTNAATIGPWTVCEGEGPMAIVCPLPRFPDKPQMAEYKEWVVGGCGCCNSPYGGDNEANDRAFIIAAREAMPKLIAEVRRLWAEQEDADRCGMDRNLCE